MSTYDTIVIGAGFAGLTTARQLTQAGHNVAIVEARDRLGGRTWYEYDRLAGFDLEMGGGWLGDDEPYVMAEVARYNIPLLRDEGAPALLLWRSNNGIRRSILPVPFEQLGDVERALGRLQSAAARIQPDTFSNPAALAELADLDIPLPDFFADLNLPEEVTGVLAGFWAGITSSTWDDMSALLAARVIAGAGGTFMDFMGTVMLGPRLLNGTKELIDALAADTAADILLNRAVTAITTTDDLVTVDTPDGPLTARTVVCTVPINVISSIEFRPPLSHVKHLVAKQGQPGRGFKLWMVARNISGGVFCMGAPGPFNHLFTVDERDDLALLVGFGAGPTPDPTDLDAVAALLHEYLPEAELVAADTHDWRQDPYAQGTWAVYPAGFITQFVPALGETENRVVWAGADYSESRPGYIDGAIESGHRAAEEVQALLNA